MRNTLAIARREILSFFVSPVAYFAIASFVLISAYFFFRYLERFAFIVEYYNQMPYRSPDSPAPNLNQFVLEAFFQTLALLLVFLVPVLTMRLISEEKRSGTFELLATSPVSTASVVLGKFFGVATVLLVMLGLSFVFPLLLVIFGSPGPEVMPMLSGALGVILCALAFAAIGMATSSFTESQVVAGMTGILTLLLLYVIYAPSTDPQSFSEIYLKRISPVMQMQDLVKGVITLESCVYFLSLMLLGIFLSQTALLAQRWR